jgi:hypothetical protein
MARCSTWRFTGGSAVDRILPVGRDHSVWKPCFQRVPEAGQWCDDCINALMICPDVEVRRALVEHPPLSTKVLRDLKTDSDYLTQARANERTSERLRERLREHQTADRAPIRS